MRQAVVQGVEDLELELIGHRGAFHDLLHKFDHLHECLWKVCWPTCHVFEHKRGLQPASNVLSDGKEGFAVGVDEPRLLAVFGEKGAGKACVVKVHVAHLLDVAVSDVAPHC